MEFKKYKKQIPPKEENMDLERWRREIRERLYPRVPEEKEKKEVLLYRCPKFQKCIMDCHHRNPHEPDRHCEPDADCPGCVSEMKSDITFFPEDFEIE